MTAKALAAPLLLALALSACSSAPQHPAPQLPDTWFSAAGAHPADAESLASWWRQFDDPQLTALVHRAMQQNHDVRLAMARVDSARAQLRQSRAGLLPSFDLPGSASRQWIENDQDAEPGSPLAEFIPDDDPIAFDSWELALQATWELDLFGATRARRDSAAQQLRSAEAQTVAARLAVAANTAQGYLQLRALQGSARSGRRHRGGARTGAHRRTAVSRRRGDPAGRGGHIRRTRIAGSRSGRAGHPPGRSAAGAGHPARRAAGQ